MKFTVKCPYCGTKQGYAQSSPSDSYEIITCDCEEGGCEKPFVVKTSQFNSGIATVQPLHEHTQGYWLPSDIDVHVILHAGVVLANIAAKAALRGDTVFYQYRGISKNWEVEYHIGEWKLEKKPAFREDFLSIADKEQLTEAFSVLNELVDRKEEVVS